MKNNKSTIRFRKSFLNELLNDEKSGVGLRHSEQHLALHPSHLTKLDDSIKNILNQGIAKYDKQLDGIILGYDGIKLLSNAGVINKDSCFIHVDIQANFYVFKVEIGQTLHGVINKVSDSHLGCLIHNTFNVSLLQPEEDEDWIGFGVKTGQEVVICVTHTDFDGHLPYIQGELKKVLSDPDSGISTSEENQNETSHRKGRKSSSNEISLDFETFKENNMQSNKRSKHTEIMEDIVEEPEVNIESSLKSKKKSKHKKVMPEDSSQHEGINTSSYLDLETFNISSSQSKKKSKHKEIMDDTAEDSDRSKTKHKHKKLISEEVSTQELTGVKKSKKRKRSPSPTDEENQEIQNTLSKKIKIKLEEEPVEIKKEKKTPKKKKIKHLEEDCHESDVSLPELNQKTLYDDHSVMKYGSSTKQFDEEETSLELKKEIISSKKTKVKKYESSGEESSEPKRRKRSLSFSQIDHETPKKKKKIKHVKEECHESDVSLPELNLDTLFDEPSQIRYSSTVKRDSSHHWDGESIDLPSDSDLENLLASQQSVNGKEKKQKKSRKLHDLSMEGIRIKKEKND